MSFISLFLTWAVIDVSGLMNITNELNGLDVLDLQGYDLRIYPLLASLAGLILLISSIVGMNNGAKSLIQIVVEVAIFAIAMLFIIKAPINETIDFGTVEYNHVVRIGFGPYLLLLFSAIAILCSVRQINIDTRVSVLSLLKKGKIREEIVNLGFDVDSNGRIMRNGRIYGLMLGSDIKIFDLDLTHNPVAYANIQSISYDDEVMLIVFTAVGRSIPINNFGTKIDNTYSIEGRGRKKTIEV